ncbi:MAG: Essential protein Yae1, N terminal, partial [Pleopsidium flavum]
MLRDTPPTPLPFPSTDNLTSLPPFADSTEHHPPLPSLHYSTNTMDDIFTSSPPPSPTSNITTQHPSDIPHLRSTHSTAGYRDGIAASKEQYIQSGFDEGYALGAVLGLRVGWILGVLEGLYAALTSKTNRGAQGREREI